MVVEIKYHHKFKELGRFPTLSVYSYNENCRWKQSWTMAISGCIQQLAVEVHPSCHLWNLRHRRRSEMPGPSRSHRCKGRPRMGWRMEMGWLGLLHACRKPLYIARKQTGWYWLSHSGIDCNTFAVRYSHEPFTSNYHGKKTPCNAWSWPGFADVSSLMGDPYGNKPLWL